MPHRQRASWLKRFVSAWYFIRVDIIILSPYPPDPALILSERAKPVMFQRRPVEGLVAFAPLRSEVGLTL